MLFVDYIAEHLSVNGRAGVIVPEGIIFQSQNSYMSLRKMLVENYLWCVVSLPAGLVAELEAERALVEPSRKLKEIFEKKIHDKVAEIWGEQEI